MLLPGGFSAFLGSCCPILWVIIPSKGAAPPDTAALKQDCLSSVTLPSAIWVHTKRHSPPLFGTDGPAWPWVHPLSWCRVAAAGAFIVTHKRGRMVNVSWRARTWAAFPSLPHCCAHGVRAGIPMWHCEVPILFCKVRILFFCLLHGTEPGSCL